MSLNETINAIMRGNDSTENKERALIGLGISRGEIEHNHYFDYVCNELKGFSKFAFMQDGKVRLFGKYEKVKGVYYSNLRWLNYYRPAYYELFTDSHNAKQAMYEELFA